MNLKTKQLIFGDTEWFQMMLISLMILMLFFFGIKGASEDVIRRDELTTLGHIGGLEAQPYGVSFSETIESLATYSAQHPPLYFLSANLWGRIFSFDSYIIRLLSLFWGLLTLATFYQLSRMIGGSIVAVYATMLLSMSIIFVFYTHEIRQYASLIFWVTLTWLLYWRFTRQTRPLKLIQLMSLTIVTTCAIYTHYLSIFFLATIGFYHLFFVPKTKAWWQISGAILVAGLLFIFWLPTMLDGLSITSGKLAKGEPKLLYNNELVGVIAQFWGNGHSLLFGTLLGLGIISAWYKQKGSRYVLFFFTTTLAIILFVNGNFEFVKRFRYVLVTIIPFYLLGGYGLALIHRWRILPISILVIWIAMGTSFQNGAAFSEQTGLDGIATYIEYNKLVVVLKQVFLPNELLITVIDDFASIDESKHNKFSVEEYYLVPLNIDYVNIDSHYARDFEIENILDKVTEYTSFWVTFRGRSRASELVEFDMAIEGDYRLCTSIDYGQKSHLEHYVAVDQFEAVCKE